ncbi:MAG: lipopolysaccharide transport periplasmic protein LptA [Acidiferrobacterales bacterium]
MHKPPSTVLGILLLCAGTYPGYVLATGSDMAAAAGGAAHRQTPHVPANAASKPGAPGFSVDRREPIHIRADRIELNQKKGMAYYRGNVVFVQGGLRITAATARAQMHDNAIRAIFAEGSPITFSQKTATSAGDIHGSASRMEYYAKKQLLNLFGNVRFRQGNDSMRSAALHYDIATGVVTAEAGSSQDQVHVVIQPAQSPDTPAQTSPLPSSKGHK